MRQAVICEPYRTPVGRFGGQFKTVTAQDLGTQLLRGLLSRSKLPPHRVDDVIFAQCYPTMDAPALGRVIALDAGLPVEVGGLQLDRRCGSGLQAVIYASMQVATGGSDLVIAGGAESMSNAPFDATDVRWGAEDAAMQFHDALSRGRVTAGGVNFPVPGGMIETAENLRRRYDVSRADQDEFAVASHQKAVAAQERGAFDEEIVPISVEGRRALKLSRATSIREPTLPSKLWRACVRSCGPPIPRRRLRPEFSGQNDGASAAIVTTPGSRRFALA